MSDRITFEALTGDNGILAPWFTGEVAAGDKAANPRDAAAKAPHPLRGRQPR